VSSSSILKGVANETHINGGGCRCDYCNYSRSRRQCADIGEHEGTTAEAKSELLSADTPVHMIAVQFYTGGDDKRSDSDVTMKFNIDNHWNGADTNSSGSEWNNNTWSPFTYYQTPSGIRVKDLSNFCVDLIEHDSFIETDDNWNINQINIWELIPNGSGGSAWTLAATPSGNPLVRLTGSKGEWCMGYWPQ